MSAVLATVGLMLNIPGAGATALTPNGCKKGVFLTISGRIGKTTNNIDRTYELSEREFLALPTSTVTTSTPWTPKSEFVGPLLSDLLKVVAAKGNNIRLMALDDFSVEVDADYLSKFGTILATTKDGVRMTVRDFGPIFVMFPRDRFRTELDTPVGASNMVWQLCGIEVE